MNLTPPSLSIHEEATNRTSWPMGPVYNNLVYYDWREVRESLETIVPELAESWSWSADRKSLTFKLRQGVRWHDGKPFTSADVKHTFDAVRGASKAGLKLNPRKLWYFNIDEIVTNGDYEVTFKVKRPQPSLLAMLASGYSPVYPHHVPIRDLRTEANGTGPFKVQSYNPGQMIVLEKNKDYFRRNRPYLDGIRFPIFRSGSTLVAAVIANQVDVNFVLFTLKPQRDTIALGTDQVQFTPLATQATINVIVNIHKPPFDNENLRRAVTLALDRNSLIRSVFGGEGYKGSVMMAIPQGVWGMTQEQLAKMPGYGDPKKNKAEARRLLAKEGYEPDKPFTFEMSTRNASTYTQPAAWALGELDAVGIKAELNVIEGGLWFSTVAQRDFTMAINATAVGIDDPDANLYENYKCGSQRNYSDYCNPALEKLYDRQSMEADYQKRLATVRQIDRTITTDGARPMLVYRKDFYAHWPYVKNYVPHVSSIYNFSRFENVWLDK
ncbi:MAG: ABC transporter substrate-binding protein [Candidatus Lambdaproteobacteria bacterium]|nr:ABC transporter substrate-binding protein [Candidatus Lambdaproteobacteria bacterium]